jgi:D-alanine transaminase
MLAYLNGQYLPKSEAKISAEDRGFIFGDGVYEVWRVIQGTLFEQERHLARLHRGLKELRIDAPAVSTLDGVLALAERLIGENGLGDGEATIYLEITRGAAPRLHNFPSGTAPTVFSFVKEFVPNEALRTKGATAAKFDDLRWKRCDIKTIQLLPNVLAKQHAAERGAIEAILVRDGVVTEGSHSNVMAVLDGELRTHPADHGILRGITRDVLLEMAPELGIRAREEAFRESDLTRVSELFLTGTTTDVTPIVAVDGQRIGDGVPGPIALKLYGALKARMNAHSSRASALAGR